MKARSRPTPVLMLLPLLLACSTAGSALAASPPLTPAETLTVIAADDAPLVLDVRTPEEFALGHVPGAVLIPHDQLAARLGELDPARPVLVYCRSGRRSTLAETLLAEAGFEVRQIDGSWLRWLEEGRPVARPAPADGDAAAAADPSPATAGAPAAADAPTDSATQEESR